MSNLYKFLKKKISKSKSWKNFENFIEDYPQLISDDIKFDQLNFYIRFYTTSLEYSFFKKYLLQKQSYLVTNNLLTKDEMEKIYSIKGYSKMNRNELEKKLI